MTWRESSTDVPRQERKRALARQSMRGGVVAGDAVLVVEAVLRTRIDMDRHRRLRGAELRDALRRQRSVLVADMGDDRAAGAFGGVVRHHRAIIGDRAGIAAPAGREPGERTA